MPARSNTSRMPASEVKSLFQDQRILMTILKEFRDGILICDHQGLILQVNAALKNVLQLTKDVTGRRVVEVIDNEAFRERLTSVLASGGSCVEEIVLDKGVSQPMFFEVHWVPVCLQPDGGDGAPESFRPADQADQNNVDGCVIILHDMTDIRRTEKMRRDFVANVSHELRTPLSAIEGYSETLLEGALSDETVCQDFINVIYHHSLRLKQLVEDLLDLSKLESPDYKPEFVPTDIRTLISQALTLVEDKAVEKDIEISVEIPDDCPAVMADSSSLQQVLTNLMDNAIKYTPTHGQVFIHLVETNERKIRVDVRDTGIGIEPKHHTRIFERFYRVDKARSRELGGTGLGLSIVKHIVQLHGGEIRVSSKLNRGSTFSFTLDCAPSRK